MPDTLDAFDGFPTITAADRAAEAAYQREQDAVVDYDRWWIRQAEGMAAEDADSNVEAECEAAWIE